MKLHASCSPDGPAERRPVGRVFAGDVMGPRRGAEPAHAVGEPRGRQPHLGVLQPFADRPEDPAGGHGDAVEANDRVAAGEAGIQRIDDPLDGDAGRIGGGQEHRRAGAVGAVPPTRAP